MTNEKKVLIIDDDVDIREFCRLVLEPLGYKVAGAGSAAEGKKLASSEAPDVIVLDIMMEEAESGLHLARWLATEHPRVPVMLVSSILDAGAQVFDISSVPAAVRLNKPLSHQELIDNVRALTGPQKPGSV